jgi:hypothetical protein
MGASEGEVASFRELPSDSTPRWHPDAVDAVGGVHLIIAADSLPRFARSLAAERPPVRRPGPARDDSAMRATWLVVPLLASAATGAANCSRTPDQTVASQPVSEVDGQAARAPVEPPKDALLLCSGHVTGAPRSDGGTPRHITWHAYSSQQATTTVVAAYLESFGAEAHSADGACDTWRFPTHHPRGILQVCPLAATGPWSSCVPPPANAKSIVLLSTMAVAD